MKIIYPRSCNCGHISNSAQSWHYHIRKHSPIPESQKCEFGCELAANFRSTSGKYCCSKISHHCPGYLKSHQNRIINQWISDDGSRKQQTKASLINRLHNEEMVEKIKRTKRENLISQDNSKDRRKYNRQVHSLSQMSLRENHTKLNPHNYVVSRTEYHLDHKVSKHVGFMLGIPASYIGHTHNLEILHYSENTKKHSKCSLHPIALLKMCSAPEELITSVEQKLVQLGDSFGRLLLMSRQEHAIS